MTWAPIAFGLSDLLSLALIVRLIRLHLHQVYKVFCAFLVFETVSTSFSIIERFSRLSSIFDYRVTWLSMRLVSWTLSIWMVYALLQAILEHLPGILRISRRLLNIMFPVSVALGILSAGPEYRASGASNVIVPLNFLVGVAVILERVIASVAVLSLLSMLFFILWFPVRMPRNLANFSIGFVVYFSAKTFLLLIHSFYSQSLKLVNNGVTFILCICLAYWIIFLNKAGEATPITLGHSWRASRQSELMNDLEALNTALVRAARR